MTSPTTARATRAAATAALALILLAGCSEGPKIKEHVGEQALGFEDQRAAIAADPIAFLRESLESARRIKSCTMIFERQERLGLFKRLRESEAIFAEYLAEPFSVRFTWQDGSSEYAQCVYVEGADDNKVLLLPRKGILGLAPTVGRYDPSLGVTFGKARNPITDFGPVRMLERTLDRIKKAEPHGKIAFRVGEEAQIGDDKEPCFHIEITYPEGDEYVCKLHDLYISARTRLPVASRVWLADSEGKFGERTDETLDASYVYSSLKADVDLTASTFVIDRAVLAAQDADDDERSSSDAAGTSAVATTPPVAKTPPVAAGPSDDHPE